MSDFLKIDFFTKNNKILSLGAEVFYEISRLRECFVLFRFCFLLGVNYYVFNHFLLLS